MSVSRQQKRPSRLKTGPRLRPNGALEPGTYDGRPQKVWIIDDYLQWSNLAYLAVSCMEYVHQLERVVCPLEEGSEVRPAVTEQQLRKAIAKKLVAYRRQDQAKGCKFNLKVDHILHLIASSYISFSRVGT